MVTDGARRVRLTKRKKLLLDKEELSKLIKLEERSKFGREG